MTLTVPCLFGLESLVADEMKRLQLKNVRAENGRVHCDGTFADIARLNINLRCGARVLMELGSFPGTISVSAVEKTNLMTVSVTAGTPNDAFRLLNGLLENYPEVGEDVLGEVVIEVFEEPAFPGGPNSVVQGKRMLMYGFTMNDYEKDILRKPLQRVLDRFHR